MFGAESIHSDIGEKALHRITHFPGTHTGEPRKILEQEIDLSDCDDVGRNHLNPSAKLIPSSQ